jgi:tRNA threonylcarbamoyladenosine biosynthesis protein TsaB
MRIVGADTTGARGSVALVEGKELKAIVGTTMVRPAHGETLLPAVDHALQSASMELSELDGFAVAAGPGSFTGLRIGIASLEGLSFALGKPLVGVSALEATAYRYRYVEGLIAVMIDAYRGDVFAEAFRADGSNVSSIAEATCEPPGEFLRGLPARPALVAGSGAHKYRAAVTEQYGQAVSVADASFFLAEEVARLGESRLARGEKAILGGVTAIYLRPSEAERNLQSNEATGA